MSLFERYLSIWVAICILVGVILGNLLPDIFSFIAALELAHVNLVVAVFIWVMIYPMMVQVDFSSIKEVSNKPKGLILTLLINWMIKPFTMALLGWLFFKIVFRIFLARAPDYFPVNPINDNVFTRINL